MCVRERECVCVCVRERECVCERERVCVCACVRERERGTTEKVRTRMSDKGGDVLKGQGVNVCTRDVFRKRFYENGACAHYVMVSKFQWKPFWLATQPEIHKMTGLPPQTV